MLTYVCNRFLRDVPQGMSTRLTDQLFQFVLIETLARANLSSIAPRGPKPDALRLQHHNLEATLCQMQRRRQA